MEILDGKTVSKEVIHNNANGFFHTGEKILLPKTPTNISSLFKVEIKHSLQCSIPNTALKLLLLLAHDLRQLALPFNGIYFTNKSNY